MSDDARDPLFLLARKQDRVVLQMLREAKSVEDMAGFFENFHKLFEDVPTTDKFCIFVDCSKIVIGATNINLSVLKAIYTFLSDNGTVLRDRVDVCGILISSRVLSLAIGALLARFELPEVSINLFYDREQCRGFMKYKRSLRRKALAQEET
jgi:hypothetical protein